MLLSPIAYPDLNPNSWIQNVGNPRRNGRIGKVLSWPNRVFVAIWKAIFTFK